MPKYRKMKIFFFLFNLSSINIENKNAFKYCKKGKKEIGKANGEVVNENIYTKASELVNIDNGFP